MAILIIQTFDVTILDGVAGKEDGVNNTEPGGQVMFTPGLSFFKCCLHQFALLSIKELFRLFSFPYFFLFLLRKPWLLLSLTYFSS